MKNIKKKIKFYICTILIITISFSEAPFFSDVEDRYVEEDTWEPVGNGRYRKWFETVDKLYECWKEIDFESARQGTHEMIIDGSLGRRAYETQGIIEKTILETETIQAQPENESNLIVILSETQSGQTLKIDKDNNIEILYPPQINTAYSSENYARQIGISFFIEKAELITTQILIKNNLERNCFYDSRQEIINKIDNFFDTTVIDSPFSKHGNDIYFSKFANDFYPYCNEKN